MLEINRIRENKQEVISALKKRNIEASILIDEILHKDDTRKKLQFSLDSTLSKLNQQAKALGILMKEEKKDQAEAIKIDHKTLKEEAKGLQNELSDIQKRLIHLLYQLPNLPYRLVKAGKNPDDNELVFSQRPPKLFSKALPHWELAKKYDIIDFELGAKITGAGFPVYKNQGARLQHGLVQFFLHENVKAGYTEYLPPLLVNEASGYGTGQLPDKEGQMYHAVADNLYLIPTSEVPLTNFYRDVLLSENQLPIKMTAYTPCFRREAGSYGKDVRGLNRLHQFDKVEIVHVEKPEDSYNALENMVRHVQTLLEKLELPYRILRLCAADMGFTSAMTYDFEVYAAAQKRWLEVSSVSNFETFQANRLKLRYKDKQENKLCHTLNGSALALPRIVAALLENNQDENGITLPEILKPFLGFSRIS